MRMETSVKNKNNKKKQMIAKSQSVTECLAFLLHFDLIMVSDHYSGP